VVGVLTNAVYDAHVMRLYIGAACPFSISRKAPVAPQLTAAPLPGAAPRLASLMGSGRGPCPHVMLTPPFLLWNPATVEPNGHHRMSLRVVGIHVEFKFEFRLSDPCHRPEPYVL